MGKVNPDLQLKDVSLTDKYTLEDGRAYMTGLQALARIPIVQRRRDMTAGLNTAGFISGYRGSPLGGFDLEVWKAQRYMDDLNITFKPGVNEDMAATALWGTQQVNLMPGGTVDGVFGIWYGKAPGVDRSMDVIRHANAYGTAPKGGILALFGDDHGCKSSTLPCQSDHVLYAAMVPQLYPYSVQEFVEYGLLGIEMSRYSGCWVGMKLTSESVETSATVDLSRENITITQPSEAEFEMPPGGVNIRLHDTPQNTDWRLQNYKLFACHAFARKNNIDRVVLDSPKPRFGIISAGKAYGDVRQALIELGITDEVARKIGLRLYKVGMTWPLEPQGVQNFVEGLEEILIVEEKRELIEYQLKQQIYNWDAGRRPVVVGKYDENGDRLLPLDNDMSVGMVAHVIAKRLQHFYHGEHVEKALKFYASYEDHMKTYTPPSLRQPYYCAGCPHNTSTKVPDGSFAMVGIGCHYMVQWMDRNSGLCTHMGGEGVPWIGTAPYTKTKHIFANLGDGTYFHSGTLAIRAAVASGVNITYKILYNDAVAMTGGQHVDGQMPVSAVAKQVCAEGVTKSWILSETPDLYLDDPEIPHNVPVLHRDFIDNVMKEARETKGTSVIIYDQTCAAEKRRRRKRGQYPDPPKRAFINKAVCEGCGDCSDQSNCVAIQPVETEFGRKRVVNQSLCNKDFSCLKGFCPSFVTVEGADLVKTSTAQSDEIFANLPEPKIPEIDHDYNIMVTGIGGTGVTTIGALIGMAAHLEDKCAAVLDQAGLAQKGGEVLSHIRLSHAQENLRTAHIIAGGADLLLACDKVTATGRSAHETLNKEKTKAVINTHYTPVASFVLDNSADFHEQQIKDNLLKSTLASGQFFIEGTAAASALLGDEIATNILMLGYAWQKGLIPLRKESIFRAIELNNVAVEANKRAFNFGRLAAEDMTRVQEMVWEITGHPDQQSEKDTLARKLTDKIARRADHLAHYQDMSYAGKYLAMTERIIQAEQALSPNSESLSRAVAENYHKLLAYKDEYEVARLYSDPEFLKDLKGTFTGKYKVSLQLAPPILGGIDPATGRPKKRNFGPWMFGVLKILSKMKNLRGTMLDPFGYSAERRAERALITEYEALVDQILAGLSSGNLALAIQILSLPSQIKGFGPIKMAAIAQYHQDKERLLKQWHSGNLGAFSTSIAAE